MGKFQQQNLHNRQSLGPQNRASSRFCCRPGSVVLRRVADEFSFKCVFVLILSLSVLVSGVFWLYPRYAIKSWYDASDAVKESATVQAGFRLEKPVSQLIPYIGRLEYDIYSEIGVPDTKVAVLSMHQSVEPNMTDVTFGVLPDPLNVPINSVYLSLLRSSIVELFLQQSNLTLTTSIFGNASMFESLKVPGGVTVIPVQLGPTIQRPEILFNFTLYNSVFEILENFSEFKHELRSALRLRSDENVYVQITSQIGSTQAPPVVVQASVTSNLGGLLPQRYLELANIISGFTDKNLSLGNSPFGKVKEVKLSSYLKSMFHGNAPSSSPAPSPQPEPSISPYRAPSYSPTSPPTADQSPCFDCEVPSPAPSVVTEHPPDPCPYSGSSYPPSSSPNSYSDPPLPSPAAAPSSHSVNPMAEVSPDQAPKPEASHGSKTGLGKRRAEKLVSRKLVSFSSSSASGDFRREILLWGFSMLSIYSLFCLSL
ncbi:putative transmembrane protein [Senna tora]|uniref:Putative transmembrane protein n=1 Tax=Senna tora TaxID=362788 RepID=A0A834XCJ4_9FABA|nr:putative transmembrane protein [Senna tora]